MLFFHGISCDERTARRIAREGLRPFRKPWIEASPSWLPRELRPDFLTCAIDADLQQRDVQVVVDHVPPEAIVALVQVSVDGRRLSPRVRAGAPTVGVGLYRDARALARERRRALRRETLSA